MTLSRCEGAERVFLRKFNLSSSFSSYNLYLSAELKVEILLVEWMSLLGYLTSPNLYAAILKILNENQISHLGKYLFPQTQVLPLFCFSLPIFLGTLCLQ